MMHPLSEIARMLTALQRELADVGGCLDRVPYATRKWSAWARTLAVECSKDLLFSPRAMLAALQKTKLENPERLQALVSILNEKALKLEKRVNNAWYQPDPMGAFLVPSWEKPRNEFQRRGRYAL